MPNSFDIPLPSLVPSSPPPFQRPKSLLSFSYSANHTLLFDDSALNIFVQPPEKADLNYGYESWIKRPEEIGRLDGLLTAIVTDPARSEAKRADVVTWRGIMTKYVQLFLRPAHRLTASSRILVAPYEDSEGWDLNVMSVNGTLYIEEHIDDAKLQSKCVVNR
jgi:RAT1-interacting protein